MAGWLKSNKLIKLATSASNKNKRSNVEFAPMIYAAWLYSHQVYHIFTKKSSTQPSLPVTSFDNGLDYFEKICRSALANSNGPLRYSSKPETAAFAMFRSARKNMMQMNAIKWNKYTTQFLEVYINEHLIWADHFHKVKSKISKTWGILTKLKYLLPQSILNTIYNNLCLPYLQCCAIIWAGSRNSILKHILTRPIHERAVTSMCNLTQCNVYYERTVSGVTVSLLISQILLTIK